MIARPSQTEHAVDGIPPARLLLDVRQVAAMLGLSMRTVWRLVSAGEIPPPVKVGRSTRWRQGDLETFVEELRP